MYSSQSLASAWGQWVRGAFTALVLLLIPLRLGAQVIAHWDFAEGAQGWTGNFYVANLQVTGDGLTFDSTGNDPWIEGPAVHYPAAGQVRVRIRMRSDADPAGELFYGPVFQAADSVRFTVIADGGWHEYNLVLPALGNGARLRLDPAGKPGRITVAWIEAELLPVIEPPELRAPTPPPADGEWAAVISAGELQLRHRGDRWGAYEIWIGDTRMGTGQDHDVIGIMEDGEIQWLELDQAQLTLTSTALGGFQERCSIPTPGGNLLNLSRRFDPGTTDGYFRISAEIQARRSTQLLHLPWITLFPGLSAFGAGKAQAVFAGLEYLADEPSSSTLDLRGPAHDRRVPDPLKITFPLMAIAAGGRYVGLSWEPSAYFAPIFDSPDRTFDTNAHLMALWAPAVGGDRPEGNLFALGPSPLEAGVTRTVRATILGGFGESVVPAVQQVCGLIGFPDLPELAMDQAGTTELLAHGWLDSDAHEDGLWRHAVWGGNFSPAPAADAPWFMTRLAQETTDSSLAERLQLGIERALERLAPTDPNFNSGVSHVRPPIAPMLFGRLEQYLEARAAHAQHLLNTAFDARGLVVYQPGATDYGHGHFENHANGLTATTMHSILETATLTGDRVLIAGALNLLDRQTHYYRNSEPRGAQTWEVPLHTPDILASAYMVHCYVLAFRLSGKPAYLEEARYWAWTGIPFVYLQPPTAGAVGNYATIPVYGATNWEAPVWIGLPVQWCGLVYANSLHLLAAHDESAPWAKIARGITAAGLQMTFPLTDPERQGLLPDVFYLLGQFGDGPAINPGTLQATVPQLFGGPGFYDFGVTPERGWLVHLPGSITQVSEGTAATRLQVNAWPQSTHHLLLSRVAQRPVSVTSRTADTKEPWTACPFTYREDRSWLILELNQGGPQEIEIQLQPPTTAWLTH